MSVSLKRFTIGQLMATISVVTLVFWSISVLGLAFYLKIAAIVLISAAAITAWRYLKTKDAKYRVVIVWLATWFGIYSVLLGVFLAIRSYILRPVGPKNAQAAIQIARSYAKQTKPSYPFDDYETFVRWDAAEECWVVDFVAYRPYIHTEIIVDRKTGECTDNPITYSLEESVAQPTPLDP